MKFRETVLVSIALILWAGVILYTVFFPGAAEPTAEEETTTTTTTAVTTVTTTEPVTETVVSTETTTAVASNKININTAGLDDLMTLKGIGEVKAQAIIDYRTQYGNFSTVYDLTLVSGIGEKTLENILDDITV